MNKIHLIGNLTRDPELTTTPNGVSVCKFSLAVSRKYSNSEGEKEVDYINVVAWRERGELCDKYLSKGKKCYIGGSLQLRNYTDKEGTKRTIAEVVADEIEFLSPKDKDEKQETNLGTMQVVFDDNELPF